MFYSEQRPALYRGLSRRTELVINALQFVNPDSTKHANKSGCSDDKSADIVIDQGTTSESINGRSISISDSNVRSANKASIGDEFLLSLEFSSAVSSLSASSEPIIPGPEPISPCSYSDYPSRPFISPRAFDVAKMNSHTKLINSLSAPSKICSDKVFNFGLFLRSYSTPSRYMMYALILISFLLSLFL